MPRIERTRQAKEDALEIWEYIAKDDPTAADRLLCQIDEYVEMLSRQPGLGTPQFQYRPALRCMTLGKYIIFYEPIDDGIRVIRILHGARQWENLL